MRANNYNTLTGFTTKLCVWALGFCLVAMPLKLSANPADSFGFGAKRLGMAQAGGATVNDWTSAFYNMAGMTSPYQHYQVKAKSTTSVGTPNRGFDQPDADPGDQLLAKRTPKATGTGSYSQVGMAYTQQFSSMNISQSGGNTQAREGAEIALQNLNYGMLYTGVVFDLRSIVNSPNDTPVALGISFGLPGDGRVATISDVSGRSYNFIRLGDSVNRFVMNAGISAQPWKERLSVGVGASFLAGGSGAFQMRGVDLDPSGQSQSPENNVKLALDGTLSPVAGIQYRQPIPGLKGHAAFAGVAFRAEQYMEMSPLDAEATTTLLNIDINMQLAVLDFYTPHTFTFSTGYEFQGMFLAHLDLEYAMWSNYKISEVRALYDTQPLDFKDTLAVRLGGEVTPGYFVKPLRIWDLKGRAGLAYLPAVTPEQKGVYNYLDNDKIMVTLGSGITIPSNPVLKIPTEINLGLGLQLWSERADEKLSAAKSGFNPNVTYSGTVFIMSLDATWHF